eukprot:213079_1
MRMKAKKKGLILTDHGLYKRTLVANGKVRAHNCNECCFRHYMQASNGKIIFEPKQSIRGTSKACEMEEVVGSDLLLHSVFVFVQLLLSPTPILLPQDVFNALE